ncbi:hypothetical protein [Parashewanella tropica]|uniref:hypothetical protein n=1 Tax=Parashewanella tropica TaxID=2547970 RepID=UPI001478BC54|nr:hypothetical protein [Parashewanella tropica]
MDTQQKADANVSLQLVKMAAICVVLAVIGYAAAYIEPDIEKVDNQAFKQEYLRLQHVLGVVRNQWIIRGKPQSINLNWQDLNAITQPLNSSNEIVATTKVKLSRDGFPLLNSNDVQGCKLLWNQLMGTSRITLRLVTDYHTSKQHCEYKVPSGGTIIYQLAIEKLKFIEVKALKE